MMDYQNTLERNLPTFTKKKTIKIRQKLWK
ncbi:hypothetical protein NTHI1209_01238 [Haemophilus influenzae]|uniref:Uncharacterized protein n=1 Tax=Haemophilus influenzae TaxID=727 RepID=A0A158SXN7_HAEIF|nr:hypothetical protein NTHI1209_01238 [Haemophilus influenzae]